MNALNMLAITFMAMVVCIAMILILRPVAQSVGLVDRPGGRKTHHGDIPLVGGLAMFLAFVSSTLLMPRGSVDGLVHLIGGAALLVAVGAFDDRFDVSPRRRLVFQTVAVLIGVSAFGTNQVSLGNIFGTGLITLNGFLAALMILLLTAGVVNAMNMIDGADGLAGIMALVASVAMGALDVAIGGIVIAPVAFALAGAVVGFLAFNFPTRLNRGRRCFMGDAGSTMLGFVLAWMALALTQGAAAEVSPVTVLWLAAVPLHDLLWSMLRRIFRGRSPFSADREHLHHLMIDGGWGVRGTFVALAALAVAWASVGIALHLARAPDWLSFAMFVLGAFLTAQFARFASRLKRYRPLQQQYQTQNKPRAYEVTSAEPERAPTLQQ